MRIHSDVLTESDVYSAAQFAGVRVVDLDVKGSQSRGKAFNFTLSGSGAHRSQWASSDHQAATWDEWGIVLNRLFVVDPLAHTGKNGYLSAEHFHWMTADRYRTLTPDDQHRRHNWLSGDTNGRSVGNAYRVFSCKCGAVGRQMMPGHSFDELSMA